MSYRIWSCLGPVKTPCYLTRLQILMLYNQQVWKPRGTFLVIACCRNRCPNTSPTFLCVIEVSLQAKLLNYFNSALLHLSPQRTTSVIFVISNQQAKINQQILSFKSCDWIREYQFLSVHKSLIPSSLSKQALAQHRRTWLRPSHSGYNRWKSSYIWEQPQPIKILLRKKLRADWSQEILAIIWCRIFCLLVCYPKT
jgi:hypothetical protein